MVFSEYVKLRILYHANNGIKPYTIVKILSEEEGITVSKVGVWKSIRILGQPQGGLDLVESQRSLNM